MHVRASQINGCSGCLERHTKELRKAGESDERIFTVAAWRDTAYFTDAERAALALAEALTRIADRADPVDDEVWDEAARHYDEKALGPGLRHRRHQHLEPAQRRHPADRRRGLIGYRACRSSTQHSAAPGARTASTFPARTPVRKPDRKAWLIPQTSSGASADSG